MTKRKRRTKRKSRPAQGLGSRRLTPELQRALDQVAQALEEGRAGEALERLAPLVAAHLRVAAVHDYLGYANLGLGNLWAALSAYERAMQLDRAEDRWLPLATLYFDLELRVHAVRALRRMLRYEVEVPSEMDVPAMLAMLEEAIADAVWELDLSAAQIERGLYDLEEGICALHSGDYKACIAANRRAIKILGDWPPPHNNLSVALFFDGHPEKAIAEAERVLANDPDSVQAMGNKVRFLAWSGRTDEAREVWTRLEALAPGDDADRIKIAEAAALLDDDESVYRLLKPLDRAPDDAPVFAWHEQFLLAVAEANLGKREARQRLEALRPGAYGVDVLIEALEDGRPGPGWSERFPYFPVSELMPLDCLNAFIDLVGRQDALSPARFRAQVERFLSRYPQLVLLGEKLIWEAVEPQAGVELLAAIGTPAAYAALRRYGLSQAGEDDARLQALFRLSEAGQVPKDEPLRVWHSGEWREVQLRRQEVSTARESTYAPEVIDLLNEALTAMQQGDEVQAERMFERLLEMNPQIKEAYNNLGAIYVRRGEVDRGMEMVHRALEIDPLYVFPRCNLANHLLNDGDLEGAKDMIEPLADRERFLPQEMAFYNYTQARILLDEDEVDRARGLLETALEIMPDYESAASLIEEIDRVAEMQEPYASFYEKQHKRDLAKRARLQAKITTADPPLREALPHYTKEVLTAMAREVIRWGGWSALRKAELVEEIAGELEDVYNVARIVDLDLDEDQRAALEEVLARGGSMSWRVFDDVFDNDLDESPYWQYHTPETTMGWLRLHGLLVEATVDGELLMTMPVELRPLVEQALARSRDSDL